MSDYAGRWHVGSIGVKDVEVIQVVRTRLLRRGEGIEGDPIRVIEQFWSLDGELLAEVDLWKSEGQVSLACISLDTLSGHGRQSPPLGPDSTPVRGGDSRSSDRSPDGEAESDLASRLEGR